MSMCLLTEVRRLSISGIAFSTAFFWMKTQASSALSWAIVCTAWSISSCCVFVFLKAFTKAYNYILVCYKMWLRKCDKFMALWEKHQTMTCFKLLLMDTRRASRHVINAIPADILRTKWWAAPLMRISSGSNEKSWKVISYYNRYNQLNAWGSCKANGHQ